MKKILLFMVAVLLIFGLVSCDLEVKIKTYKVSYDANGAVGNVPTPIEVEEGRTMTVPSCGFLSRKGYDFAGWNTKKDGNGRVYKESQFIKVDSDISLYAQWSLHTYSISYDLDGGSYPEGRSNPNKYTIETDTFILNNPGKDGYEFLGWSIPENNYPNKIVSIEKGATGDLSFIAVWRPLSSYLISYDLNGGEGSIKTVLKLEGESVEIASASEVSRKGYEFVFWNTEPDGTGKDYNSGESYEEDENLQLYAKWSIVRYSIEYNLNDGELATGKSNPVEYTVETSDIVLENPTRYGYEFVGWKYKDDSDVSASTNFSIKKGTTGDLSIIAVWKALDTYTVSYDANGGTGTIETQSKYKGESLTISSGEDLERNGYTFICWNTKADGTGTDYSPNDSYSADADLKLYAKWNPIKYSIRYDLDGGAFPEGSIITEYTIETDTFTLSIPMNPGYAFVGWNTKGSSETQEIISIEKGSTRDFEFTAVWRLESYFISYDLAGGTLPEGLSNPCDYTIETETFTLVNPKKDGYVFSGWIESCPTSEIEEKTVSIKKGSTGDRSFIAVWRLPKKYAVIFDSNGADGGSVPSLLVVCEGDSFKVPSCGSLYRDDYVFEEWNTRSDGNGSRYSISEEIEIYGNITLYAIWKESPLEYTYLSESDSYSVKCKDKSVSSIVIPSMYKGKSITKVGNSAFSGCSDLESITIPEGVTSIDLWAFSSCRCLESIMIPEGVTSIDSQAFSGCSGLESIEVEEGNSVYYSEGDCLIERDTKRLVLGCRNSVIPGSVTSIGNYAFSGCSGLTGSLVIPEGVTSIGYYAFSGCRGLTGSLVIPEGVTSIGDGAFGGCSGLTSVTIPEGVTYIGGGTFKNCTGLTSITIPSSVTNIWGGTFKNCSGLLNVTMNEGLESIEERAFEGCSNLIITIPSSVKQIGEGAFYNCNEASITIEGDGMSIGPYAFNGCKGAITINGGVTKIWAMAFKDCTGLTGNLTIQGDVADIGRDAFYGCSGLTSVTIQAGVVNAGYAAFYGCSGLASVTIQAGVVNADYAVFYSCSGLTSITIQEGVTHIESFIFSGCSGLESIEVEEGNSVYYSEGDCLIERDTKRLVLGCRNSVIPGSVTSIGNYAFSGCSGLTGSLVIPEGVTSIGDGAFGGCSGLTGSLVIPEGVTSIGDSAFYGCSGLTGSLVIPEGVTSIGDSAFYGCSGLTGSLVIPEGVTIIENGVFSNCSNLTNITISSGVTSIKSEAFRSCRKLENISYLGTKAQWNSISKGESWSAGTGNYTIHCTDGDIAKN